MEFLFNSVQLFGTNLQNIQSEDFFLFNLEINDTYNAKLVGQINSFCWNSTCDFPPVKGLLFYIIFISFLFNFYLIFI